MRSFVFHLLDGLIERVIKTNICVCLFPNSRMFPSLRTALSGLDDDTNYCVMIEMVPIGECRFKYSGTQWVPAGGPEPQSNCRMYLHPDSPALGSHWMAQPVLFNKIKLTNNTLDHSGHVSIRIMCAHNTVQ